MHIYHPEPRVILQRFPDGAVLYTPSNETYLGLNETGVRIWEILPKEGIGFEALLREVAAAYPDAPVDDLRADLTAWLSEVESFGLLRRESAVAA
ncbi:MAG: PqqD family protein [Gemmatimonadetes bacterium]|nr:PqqD family protein [Gemmatimonadota bacterium]